ncbi:hydroxymethylglutaryl-CoA reductase [Thermoflexibacter ruber]|uniref:3-hydroxy-3-methylglutaryl-coenzyme A reductase n=1 Tax=Thermoflexibacter ruber TaxID=1003 RepID=A0A1I2IU87_9BACT|nr:hydroxymethylglutaryl-CoA reductase [Thermoflexibacter ruber]SFF46002.1 3-hydroxy-3-methylglutaryl-coenzyme A reductase [Thermoflexibacter ruber]
MEIISGFSKLSKSQKLAWLAEQVADNKEEFIAEFESYLHRDTQVQKLYDEFSENTLTNFYMPYGLVPNVMINGKLYAVPMVIEESSVVAAAAGSAKFWLERGGFKAKVIDTKKIGQVHFLWEGDFKKLDVLFDELREVMLDNTALITSNMRARGGGIIDIDLVNMTHIEPHYYQIKATFETCESMGANFINTCLEEFARSLKDWMANSEHFVGKEKEPLVIMSILSNYTPECLVRAWVECPVAELGYFDDMPPELFAYKFSKALMIAKNDPHRATTHNKGIFNGIDAVTLATGNDFRAIEACGHTYACRNGKYQSLTDCSIEDGMFKFWIEVPIAVGTVGGLTSLHPLVKKSFEILDSPNAQELMQIMAVIGLAQNFGAVKSLITTGIQKGHMKMHLLNILKHFDASETEVKYAIEHFKTNVVSFRAVRDVLDSIRVKVKE